MTFHRLKNDPTGAIVLVNLHYLVTDALVDRRLAKSAFRAIKRSLGATAPTAGKDELKLALQAALFVDHPIFQVQGVQQPKLDKAVAMVVDFGKVRGMLTTLLRRETDLALISELDSILRPDVDRGDIPKAADLINRLSPKLRAMTLNDLNQVLWGASVPALDAAIVGFRSDPAIGQAGLAGRLRDLLGLIHIKPRRRRRTRHLFLFRGRRTLEAIRGAPTSFRCARPTTFDGFDNRRFCQPTLTTPWEDGWGMTIDIAGNGLAVGMPEVVVNPLPVADFECSYLGEVPDANFGSDADYLDLIATGVPPLDDIADHLDRLAA